MINLFVCGFFAVIVIYPLLHELGHVIVALFIGADIIEIGVLPVPFIACELSAADYVGQAFIGMGGNAFPFVLSICLNPKKFWFWYAVFITRIICVIVAISSLVATLFYYNGAVWKKDDIVQSLQIFPNGKWMLITLCTVIIVYGVIKTTEERPFLRCEVYFGVKTNTKS